MRCSGSAGIILVVVLTTTACTTATQRIPVTSLPVGAAVTVGSFRGVTPTVIEVPRTHASHAVRISKEGYKTEVIRLRRIITPSGSGTNPLAPVDTYHVSGRIAGGAVGGSRGMTQGGGAGAMFGMAIVAAELQSGARYRLYPVSIDVTLEPGDPRDVNDSALREIERLKAQGAISDEEYKILREGVTEESK